MFKSLSMLMILGVVRVAESQINIQSLRPEGALFEKIADVLAYHNNWKIFTKLEVIDEQDLIEYLQNANNQTATVCSKFADLEKEEECAYWKKEITQKIEQIKNRFQGIHIFLKTKRPRRALINAVGKLSKFLFGTMDADDAEDINKKISSLDDQNKKTLHLMEKQISITKTNFKNIDAILGNTSIIQQEFEQRLRVIEKQSEHFHDLMGNLLLNKLMININSRIEQLHRYLSDQYEVITALKMHILHPLLLDTENLKEIYKEITRYEKEHHLTKNYQVTNQLITVTTEVVNDEIWIQINVPLLEQQVYTMYHAYELPTTDNKGITHMLDFDKPYLLNNSATQTYIELTEKNVAQQCKRCDTEANKELMACHIPQARLVGTESNNCLTNLFRKRENNAKSCKHKVSYDINDLLIKLHQDNAWLFVFQYPQQLLVQCKENMRQYTLEKYGIMTLTKDCRYSINAYELPYVKNKESTLQVHQPEKEDLPKFELDTKILEKPKVNNNKNKLILAQHADFHQTIRAGLKDLDDLQANIQHSQTYELPGRIQSHTNSIIIILIIITLLATAFCRRHYYQSKGKGKNTKSNQIELSLIGHPQRKPANMVTNFQSTQHQQPPTLEDYQAPTRIRY